MFTNNLKFNEIKLKILLMIVCLINKRLQIEYKQAQTSFVREKFGS